MNVQAIEPAVHIARSLLGGVMIGQGLILWVLGTLSMLNRRVGEAHELNGSAHLWIERIVKAWLTASALFLAGLAMGHWL